MPDPIVVQRMNAYRAALLRQEAAQMRDMAARWTTVERSLAQSITDVLDEIARREAAGEDFGRTFGPYVRLERYQALLRQVRTELTRYGAYTTGQVQRGIADHVGLGVAHGTASIEALAGDAPGLLAQFNRLSVPAIENMAAALQHDAPVGQLLADAFPNAAVRMTEALINGVALGWNPRKTARAMREGLQAGALQRSLVIARTEQLRAYRTATLETYRQSGVVVGYKRLAAKSARTCIACLMADGTFYPLEESFEEHPNGRCTLVPVVKGRPAPEWETGRTWFERQPADVQRGILGPAAFEAWQAGAIRLEDLVERHEHPVWGGSLGQRSLRSLLGANDAGYFARLAIFRPRAVPRDLGADVARRAIQQGERLAEVQAMGRERLLTLRTSLQSATYLPKAAQHFGRHQHEFADLGIDDEKAYQALFLQHINRNDLQVFTYISSKPPHYRMWSMVGMDNGVVVLYNEDKQKHWSMFRSTSLAQYHDSGRAWWVEVVFSERGARIEPW